MMFPSVRSQQPPMEGSSWGMSVVNVYILDQIQHHLVTGFLLPCMGFVRVYQLLMLSWTLIPWNGLKFTQVLQLLPLMLQVTRHSHLAFSLLIPAFIHHNQVSFQYFRLFHLKFLSTFIWIVAILLKSFQPGVLSSYDSLRVDCNLVNQAFHHVFFPLFLYHVLDTLYC